MLKCPQCGHENRPGTFCCDNCLWLLSDEGSDTIKVSEELRQELNTAYDSYHAHNLETHLPPQALRMVFETSSKSITLLPKDKPYLIGRRAQTNSYLTIDLSPHNAEDLGVSRRHAMLYMSKKQWFIEDLGSTNGTFINEHRLGKKERYIVQGGDLLQFGLLTALVQIGDVV